jgi:hypothetical protein
MATRPRFLLPTLARDRGGRRLKKGDAVRIVRSGDGRTATVDGLTSGGGSMVVLALPNGVRTCFWSDQLRRLA